LLTSGALKIAQDSGLDLVEIAPTADPPVCKIMDYGKYRYDESKKLKEQRQKNKTQATKEVKFRPKTDEHDIDFKTRNIRKFLESGNKVRMSVSFQGREIIHKNVGQALLQNVFQELIDIATIEQIPSMEGRQMFMIIGPKNNRPS
jgi:translation initiation factor IF-3